jgi:hypothetical protein
MQLRWRRYINQEEGGETKEDEDDRLSGRKNDIQL